MKKIITLLISCFITIASFSQNQLNNAFYIYRNDGIFNAFFYSEVDSIVYSALDADGIEHNDIVTQEICTEDSIYRIPIAAIDSVGFIQPKNVLKPNVKSLTGSILDFLVKSEDVYLYFLTTTPPELLPVAGDKLVTIEMTEKFPYGFFGEVLSVRNKDGFIVVECNGLELEDVFESYCYSVDIHSVNENTSRVRKAPNIDTVFHVPTLSHAWSLGIGHSMFNVKNTVEASLTPRFHVKGNDLVDPKRGRLTDIRITGNYITGTKYEFGFEVSPDPLDFPFPGGIGEYPICPGLAFFWDFGMFVGVSGSLTYSQSFTQEYVSHIDYKREGLRMPTINFGCPSLIHNQRTEPRIALKGSVRGGFYGELGICPMGLGKDNPLGKVSGRLEIGVEAEMERGIDLGGLENADRTTALYDYVDNVSDLTANTLTISPYASVNITVRIGPWNNTWMPRKWKLGSPFYQGGFFPHFANTSYERDNDSGIVFKSDLSRFCPFPWQIGFSVFDLNGNHIKTEYYGNTYWNPYQFDSYKVTINGLKQNGEYRVYPVINVFEHRVLASPYVIVHPCPVKLSDFKVTKSQYNNRGFTNDGMTYDYRFDVSVTATLEDETNVHDWGYIYRDPNGREKKISLVQPSGYGTSYTDTRYAYFRNENPSNCTLYGYVEYVGSDKPVFGEPHDFPLEYGDICPDESHPHWVDLGLPSGTLWRCCNEGASKPEELGEYYEFGANPQAPTFEQIKELLDNCTSVWTTLNGARGRKFCGSNGAIIFLPSKGEEGYYQYGDYWSSTRYDEDEVYWLRFDADNAEWIISTTANHIQSEAWDAISIVKNQVRPVANPSSTRMPSLP